jgi:hypothetical protein
MAKGQQRYEIMESKEDLSNFGDKDASLITECSLLHSNKIDISKCIRDKANKTRPKFKEGGKIMEEENSSLLSEENVSEENVNEENKYDMTSLDDIEVKEEEVKEEEVKEEEEVKSDTDYLINALTQDPKLFNILEDVIGTDKLETIMEQDMEEGGDVSGMGGPTDDKVPALLSDGEYVINAESTAAIGEENLDDLNSVKEEDKPKFALGGFFSKLLNQLKQNKGIEEIEVEGEEVDKTLLEDEESLLALK